MGGEQRLRTSTLARECPERGEEQEVFRGEPDELSSPNPLQDDSTRDGAEAENDFGSFTGEVHLSSSRCTPRHKLYVPREETLPIPMKCIDVTRTTYTSPGVLLETNVDDYWNVDGEKELSDAWTGFTRFILSNEKPPDGYMVRGEIYEETNNLSSRQCMARSVGTYV